MSVDSTADAVTFGRLSGGDTMRLSGTLTVLFAATLLASCAGDSEPAAVAPPPSITVLLQEIGTNSARLAASMEQLKNVNATPPDCSREQYVDLVAGHYARSPGLRIQVVLAVDDSPSAKALLEGTKQSALALLPLFRGGDRFVVFTMNDHTNWINEPPPSPSYDATGEREGWPDDPPGLPIAKNERGESVDPIVLETQAKALTDTDLQSLKEAASVEVVDTTLGTGSRPATEAQAKRRGAQVALDRWVAQALTWLTHYGFWNTTFEQWLADQSAWELTRNAKQALCDAQTDYGVELATWRTDQGALLSDGLPAADDLGESPIGQVTDRARRIFDTFSGSQPGSASELILRILVIGGDAELYNAQTPTTRDYVIDGRPLVGIHVIVGPYRPSTFAKRDYNVEILRKSLATACPLSVTFVSDDTSATELKAVIERFVGKRPSSGILSAATCEQVAATR